MPYSIVDGKEEILQWMVENSHEISTILDIGAGAGIYRDYFHEKMGNKSWDAVEIWQPYIDRFQLQKKYTNVFNDDIRKFNWQHKQRYSIAIAGDILEHMTKIEACDVVKHALEHCTTLIISIPVIELKQDAVYGNPYEIHVKPDWSHDEVMSTWHQNIFKFWTNSASPIGVYWLRKNCQKLAA